MPRIPRGRFDVDAPNRPLLFWEPYPKRLRVVVDGETIADSRDCIALHQSGKMMVVCVPETPVRRDLLSRGEPVKDRLGDGTRWSMGGRDAVARSIDTPPASAQPLADHFVFDLDKADAWYLEDDLGYAHPRDPYHRVDVHRSSRHVQVSANGTMIAESSAPAILFETSIPDRFYLPPDAVRTDILVRSETITKCPYKGDGQHWHVKAGSTIIEDACWSLTSPLGDALTIPRWFSFYTEKLDVELDGQKR